VEGDELYRTSLGACCTILMLALVSIFAVYVFKRAVDPPMQKKLSEITFKEYFEENLHIE